MLRACLWEISGERYPISPCYTLYTAGRYGVIVRIYRGEDGTQDCAPGVGTCSDSPPIPHQAPGI